MAYRIEGIVLLSCLLLPLTNARAGEISPSITPNYGVIDHFNKADAGGLPRGWKPYKKKGKEIYRVRVEEERVYVEAKAEGLAVQLTKEIKLDPAKTPFLSWRWRIHRLPTGGDERGKKTNDSGAGVYVIFNKGWPKMKKYTLKYVWSAASLTKGSYYKGHYSSHMYTIIQENRETPQNQWIQEKVNIWETYRKIFKKDKVPEIIGIALMSDSDDTYSLAWADYADLSFTSN
jgi:hypothetical protein